MELYRSTPDACLPHQSKQTSGSLFSVCWYWECCNSHRGRETKSEETQDHRHITTVPHDVPTGAVTVHKGTLWLQWNTHWIVSWGRKLEFDVCIVYWTLKNIMHTTNISTYIHIYIYLFFKTKSVYIAWRTGRDLYKHRMMIDTCGIWTCIHQHVNRRSTIVHVLCVFRIKIRSTDSNVSSLLTFISVA